MSATKDLKISPPNLLSKWGSMEDWAEGTSVAPSGWRMTGTAGSVAQESTEVKHGTYAMKIVSAAGASYMAESEVQEYDEYRGKTIRAGCWIKTSSASKARIYVSDGLSMFYSPFHSGGGAFEMLEVQALVGSSNTKLVLGAEVGSGTITGYFDSAIMVDGQTLFTYFQGSKTYLREVDIDIGTNFVQNSVEIARRDGKLVRATKVGEKSIRIKVQMYGDSYSEARQYYQDLVRACSDGVKDFYVSNDRIYSVRLTGIPKLKYQADLQVLNAEFQFTASDPFEKSNGMRRKIIRPNSSPYVVSLDVGGSYKSLPLVSVNTPVALSTITLENMTSGQVFTFGQTTAAGTTLQIDCDTMEVRNNLVDGISVFTGDFMHLVPGSNTLKYTGAVGGTIYVDWYDRWL